MAPGWAYGNEAADGRVSDPAAACCPVALHEAVDTASHTNSKQSMFHALARVGELAPWNYQLLAQEDPLSKRCALACGLVTMASEIAMPLKRSATGKVALIVYDESAPLPLYSVLCQQWS
jgi:hypothetical protein